MTLKYEKLVEDPVAELRRITDFLAVDYHNSMLEYDKKTTYSKPQKGNSEKWRRVPPAQLSAAEFRAAPWLEKAGYLPSQPKRRPARIRLLTFEMQCRIHGIRFRRRRYGTRLWLEDVVSRRIGTKQWCDSVRQRVHSIQERHLK